MNAMNRVTRNSEIQIAAEKIALAAEKIGYFMTPDHCERLENMIRRTRPIRPAINRAIDTMALFSKRRTRDFLLAAVAVMEADGVRHQSEVELLNQLSTELIGASVI
jgi:tellurite resistance protein